MAPRVCGPHEEPERNGSHFFLTVKHLKIYKEQSSTFVMTSNVSSLIFIGILVRSLLETLRGRSVEIMVD